MLKKLLLLALVLAGCAAHAQIPTRWLTNGNFDDFVIGGVYTAGATLGAGNCGAPWPTSNGFVATTNNNSNPNVTVPGWRSTDGNQINAGLGISTTGGAFNNCGTIGIASGWTEIFTTAVGNGSAQSGNYFNHNNPNNHARTYQNMCILPSDTPYYGISVRGRNDVNERIAIGIWSAANVGTIVNSTAGAVAGNSVGGGNVWGVDLSVTSTTVWSNYNKTTSPFPGLVGGQIPATWVPGIYGVGMQSSNGSGGGPGAFAGNPVEGAFSDTINWEVSPFIDLGGFNNTATTSIGIEGSNINLTVRVNGRLRSPASVIIRQDRTQASLPKPVVDFTVGAPNRGTTIFYSSTQTVTFGTGTIQVFPGDVQLNLPAGDYDPNYSNGASLGLINIPFTLTNDGVVEALEVLRYTLGNPAATTGTDTTDTTGGGDARPDTGLAVSKGNQSTLCSLANKTAQLDMVDNDKPTLTKAFAQPSVALGGTMTLTFTLTNPADVSPTSTSRVTATSINFTDNAPGTGVNGLQFVASSPVTTSAGCVGGTFNTTSTASFVATGVGIASSPSPGAVSCQITVQMQNRIGSAPNTACTSPTTGPANFLNTSITGTNTASVGGTTTATLSPITVAACLNVLTAVDISAAKTISKPTIPLGGTASFSIVFVNNGPSAMPLSGFIDTLPSQLTTSLALVSSTQQGGATTSNFVVSPSTFAGSITMPAGSTITIVMGVTATAVVSSFTNTVGIQLNAAVADSTPGNTTATAVGTVTLAADLRIFKTNGSTTLLAGSTTSYTVTVSNFGPSAADNAVVTDPVATGLQCITPASCTATGGASCASPIPIATLQSGYSIPSLPNGGEIRIVVICGVTATGL